MDNCSWVPTSHRPVLWLPANRPISPSRSSVPVGPFSLDQGGTQDPENEDTPGPVPVSGSGPSPVTSPPWLSTLPSILHTQGVTWGSSGFCLNLFGLSQCILLAPWDPRSQDRQVGKPSGKPRVRQASPPTLPLCFSRLGAPSSENGPRQNPQSPGI